MRQRLFGRFYRELIKRAAHTRHGCHPYSECLRHRAAHTEASSGSHRTRRLHLYCRIRIRYRRDHSNGKNFPPGVRSPQRDTGCPGILEAVQKDLQESGIKAEISPDINRDTFIKWSFISAMAVTGAYYDVPMGEVQKPGKIRGYIYRTFYGKRCLRKETGRRISRRPSQLQPKSD